MNQKTLETIAEKIERVRCLNYDCIDTETAHNRIDLLAEAVDEILAELRAPKEPAVPIS